MYNFRAFYPRTKTMVVFDMQKAVYDQYIAHHVCLLLADMHPEGKGLMMQSTGLSDKNGVDIYEGDILFWDEEVVGAVSFGYAEYVVGKGVSARALCCAPCDDIKVIGNIHENPELMEE